MNRKQDKIRKWIRHSCAAVPSCETFVYICTVFLNENPAVSVNILLTQNTSDSGIINIPTARNFIEASIGGGSRETVGRALLISCWRGGVPLKILSEGSYETIWSLKINTMLGEIDFFMLGEIDFFYSISITIGLFFVGSFAVCFK